MTQNKKIMKKVFGIIAAITIVAGANAQIKTNAGTFSKPSAGSWLVQGSFTPNLSSGTLFSLPSFNGTTGVSARKFSSESKATRYSAALAVSNSGATGAETAFGVAVGIGVENHKKGAERLSTYWGYGGMVGYSKDVLKTSRIGVEAQLFTGFDYYVVPNVYIGAEMGFGLGLTNTKPDVGDATTGWGLGSGITPVLRLGWKL